MLLGKCISDSRSELKDLTNYTADNYFKRFVKPYEEQWALAPQIEDDSLFADIPVAQNEEETFDIPLKPKETTVIEDPILYEEVKEQTNQE